MPEITLRVGKPERKITFWAEIVSARKGRTLYQVVDGFRVARRTDDGILVLTNVLPEAKAREVFHQASWINSDLVYEAALILGAIVVVVVADLIYLGWL
jgi:hypothetical protein